MKLYRRVLYLTFSPFFICLFFSNAGFSQIIKYSCGDTEIQELDLGNYTEEDCLNIPQESIVVPVVFHIFYNDDIGPNVISLNQIDNALATLNANFNGSNGSNGSTPASDAKIQFCLAQTLPNGAMFPESPGVLKVNATGSTYEDRFAGNGWDLSQLDPNEYLNIYLHDAILWKINLSTLLATLVPGKAYPGEGVAVTYENLSTTLLTHEIGHYFGLYHSFREGCPDSGQQAHDHGDHVIDTDPHVIPRDDDGNYLGNLCDPTETNECTSQPLGDVVYNFMNYCLPENLDEFTSCQAYRMHEYQKLHYPDLPGGCPSAYIECTSIDATARACDYVDGTYNEFVSNVSLEVPEGFELCSSNLFSLASNVDYTITSQNNNNSNGSIGLTITVNTNQYDNFSTVGATVYTQLCNAEGEVLCFTINIRPQVCDSCEPPIYISLNCVEVFPDDPEDTYVHQNNTTFYLPDLGGGSYTHCGTSSTNANYAESVVVQHGNQISYDFAVSSSSNQPQTGSTTLCFEDEAGNTICKEVIYSTKPCGIECDDSIMEDISLTCGEPREDGYYSMEINGLSQDLLFVYPGYKYCGAATSGSLGIEVLDARPFIANLFVPCKSMISGQENIEIYMCGPQGDVKCINVTVNIECEGECNNYDKGRSRNKTKIDNRITIAPNPTQDYLHIGIVDLKLDEVFELEIRNTTGILIRKEVLTQEREAINLEGLKAGVYFVYLTNKLGESHIQKIIKL